MSLEENDYLLSITQISLHLRQKIEQTSVYKAIRRFREKHPDISPVKYSEYTGQNWPEPYGCQDTPKIAYYWRDIKRIFKERLMVFSDECNCDLCRNADIGKKKYSKYWTI
jgi:hypothetical protein